MPEAYRQRSYAKGRGDEVINGVTVHRVKHFVPNPPVGGMGRMRLDASYLANWAKRLWSMKQRPDVMLLVAPPFLIGFLGWLFRLRFASNGKHIPLVYHVQDLQVDAALDLGMLPQKLGGVLRFIERIQLERMDAVTTVSQGMAKRLGAKCQTRRRVRILPNWADTTAMVAAGKKQNSYRAEWGIGDDDMVLLYSGNLGKKQGLDGILSAADQLRDLTHLHWVIAGQGAERDELAAKANELDLPRLRFLDLQPKERLAEFLAAADVHLLPQKKAAADLVMPSKLLNILSVGRPLVVAAEAQTELGRTIRAANCGALVPPEDPTAMAQAIADVTADRKRLQEMGASGQVYVREHLDREPVLRALARSLIRLMQK